jgi:hypothetical protein
MEIPLVSSIHFKALETEAQLDKLEPTGIQGVHEGTNP